MGTEVEALVETQFGDLELLVAIAPFDQAKVAIEAANGKLATAQQVAQARIAAGPYSNVSQCSSWAAENFVYFPNGKIIVTPAEHSPILKHASKATESHKSGKEFYVSDKEAASLEKLAKSGKVYTLNHKESYYIPIEKFAQDSLARFVFGYTATDYAKFLRVNSVKAVPVWLVGAEYQKDKKQHKAPFARALWLLSVFGKSGLGGDNRNLDWGNVGVHGVRMASEASTTQTNVHVSLYETIARKFGYESPEALQRDLQALIAFKRQLK